MNAIDLAKRVREVGLGPALATLAKALEPKPEFSIKDHINMTAETEPAFVADPAPQQPAAEQPSSSVDASRINAVLERLAALEAENKELHARLDNPAPVAAVVLPVSPAPVAATVTTAVSADPTQVHESVFSKIFRYSLSAVVAVEQEFGNLAGKDKHDIAVGLLGTAAGILGVIPNPIAQFASIMINGTVSTLNETIWKKAPAPAQ